MCRVYHFLFKSLLVNAVLASAFVLSSCGSSFKPFEQKESGSKIYMETGVNQIVNGDFHDQGKSWNFYLNGGNATARYSKNKVTLSVNSLGNVNYGVQYYYDGFRMYRTGKYTFSFTASSDKPKGCEVRIQLNGGDYHAYAIDTYTFGTEPKTYSIDFEMTESSDMTPRLAFNLGTFSDRDEGDTPYEVVISNVSLILNNKIVEEAKGNGGADIVRVNQVGYLPDAKKIAFVKVKKNGLTFSVLDENGAEVYSAKLSNAVREEKAYEYTAKADFSSVTKPGSYMIKVNDDESFPVVIENNSYDSLLTDSLRYFYLSRCGAAIEDKTFGHEACHLGKARIIGSDNYAEADGGWHDAGDYGRYVVPGAKSVVDLLYTYSLTKNSYTGYDILGEAKYELDWMLKMQRDDGAVFHKITCLKFPGFVMPQYETEGLFLSPISTPATADFAATMAFASTYYRSIDSTYADILVHAAEKAWSFLEQNQVKAFSNPSTVETGAYGDRYDADERYFAATALALATGDSKKYGSAAETLRADKMAANWKEEFGWAQMEAYGDELVAFNPDLFSTSLVTTAKEALIKQADILLARSKASGFSVALDEVVWGSNMEVCNDAHLLAIAYDLTSKQEYRDAARAQIDYILGCNPMSECYVTGFGDNSPQHPHHRPSIAMNTPMRGMLVGGPDQKLEDPFAQNLLDDKPALMCYVDNNQSYSTNEITIYWNSAFVYSLAKLYF